MTGVSVAPGRNRYRPLIYQRALHLVSVASLMDSHDIILEDLPAKMSLISPIPFRFLEVSYPDPSGQQYNRDVVTNASFRVYRIPDLQRVLRDSLVFAWHI